MTVGQGTERTLVYGVRQDIGEEVVFIKEDQARELAEIWTAVNEAKTWGEFRSRVRGAYDAILESWHEDDEPVPPADEAFEPSRIPGLDDGDWPGWPAQDMLSWMPDDIQRQYGRVTPSVLNGDYLELPANQTAEIVAALEAHGYRCGEDQDLVERACGW